MGLRVIWSMGGVAAAIPLATVWTHDGIGTAFALLSTTLLLTALWRPAYALACLAACLPLAVPLLVLLETPVLGLSGIADALSLAVIAGACGHEAIWRQPLRTRLARPALLVCALLGAAGVVGLAVPAHLTGSPGDYAQVVVGHLTETYLTDPRVLDGWHPAAVWIQAVALAVLAERAVRRSAESGVIVLRVSATALAAAATFSLVRLLQIALASGTWVPTLTQTVLSARISPHLPDVNATGSLMAMAIVVWAVLATTGVRPLRTRLAALAVTGVVGLALWLTGSRAAQGAALLITAGSILAWRRPRARVLVGAAGVALALVATLAVWNPGRAAQSGSAEALGVRVDMARIALALTADAPLFGVGPGQFQQASVPLVSDALIARFPQTRVGENAHNQFLQTLAELGLVGAVAMGWLLLVAARGATAEAAEPALRRWIHLWSAGLLAFLLSAAFGHPFLMPPVLLSCLLVLGVIAAGAPVPAVGRHVRRALLVAVLLVLATIPFRAREAVGQTDLDHHVIGASSVIADLDGRAYRAARPASTWFVRVSARVIDVPLRVDPEVGGACRVRLLVDGFPANEVDVTDTAWTHSRFALTAGKYRQVNRRLDIIAPPDCALLVGRFDILD